MLTRIKRLPSPALVISAIALIVAVGGGTFALASSSDNKKDKKIANKQINKKVPDIAKKQANKQISKKAPGLSVLHAQSADTATNADNATTTNAVTSFAYGGANGDVNKTVLDNFHGLTLLASCTSGANNGLTVRATSATPNAEISMSDISQAGPPAGTASNDSFSQIGSTPLVLTSPSGTVKTTNGAVGIGFASGQFVYFQPNGGSRVTVQWLYNGGIGNPSGHACNFAGTATGTDNGPPDVAKRATASSAGGSGLSSAQRVRRAG